MEYSLYKETAHSNLDISDLDKCDDTTYLVRELSRRIDVFNQIILQNKSLDPVEVYEHGENLLCGYLFDIKKPVNTQQEVELSAELHKYLDEADTIKSKTDKLQVSGVAVAVACLLSSVVSFKYDSMYTLMAVANTIVIVYLGFGIRLRGIINILSNPPAMNKLLTRNTVMLVILAVLTGILFIALVLLDILAK